MSFFTKTGVAIRKFFDKTFVVYNSVIMIIVFVVTVYPFWYILLYSISDATKVTLDLMIIPKGLSFESYVQTFRSANILNAFSISVNRALIGSIASTFVTMMVAYSLSRPSFAGKKFFNTYFIITMYISAGLIPTYLLMKDLKLVGSFWVYVLPGIMNAYNMIIMRTYMRGISDSLIESAEIDGANHFVIFLRIMLPLSLPVVAALTLFSAVGHWNSYTDTVIYNSGKESLWTLQFVLMQMVSTISSQQSEAFLESIGRGDFQQATKLVTPASVRMAITIITIVPISLAYPFLQRYFVEGIMIGAVKE